MRAPRPRHRGAAWVLAGVALASCDDAIAAPDPLEISDGDYVLSLSVPVVTHLVTPSWMELEPRIFVTKSGTDLAVTGSTDDIIVTGPAARFEARGDHWLAHFEWEPSPEHHYWSVELAGTGCAMAMAVDDDLGIGPGGVWTVLYSVCTLEAG